MARGIDTLPTVGRRIESLLYKERCPWPFRMVARDCLLRKKNLLRERVTNGIRGLKREAVRSMKQRLVGLKLKVGHRGVDQALPDLIKINLLEFAYVAFCEKGRRHQLPKARPNALSRDGPRNV